MEKSEELKYLKELGDDSKGAFDELFRHYYPKLKNFLLAMLKDEEEAKDVAQSIFVKVWAKRKSISEVRFFSAYLFRMAKNAVYDCYDRNQIREYSLLEKESVIPFHESPIEDSLYASELEELINIAISGMPERRREIFLMSRQDGLSNKEIAKELDINQRTVENQITTALSMLREVVTSFKTLLF